MITCSNRYNWCYFCNREATKARIVQQIVKLGDEMMIWDCMILVSPSIIYRIRRWMNQHMYREILEQELIHTTYAYNMNPTSLIF